MNSCQLDQTLEEKHRAGAFRTYSQAQNQHCEVAHTHTHTHTPTPHHETSRLHRYINIQAEGGALQTQTPPHMHKCS